MTEETKQEMSRLSLLMQLEAMARQSDSVKALQFLVVNELRHLVSFRQAFLFSTDVVNESKYHLEAASSIAVVDRNAPYVHWLETCLHRLHKDGSLESLRLVDAKSCPEDLREGWKENSLPFAIWCPFQLADGRRLGGIWLTREKPWTDNEAKLIGRISDTFAHAWFALIGKEKLRKKPHYERLILGSVLFIIASFFIIPVRISALAPVEVVAKDPTIVSAPMDGVIKDIMAPPNSLVLAGMLLFRYEDTGLRNKYEIAEKTLAVALAEFRKASQQAFGDQQSNAEVALLKAQVELNRSEARYAFELLNQVEVKANKNGLLIYTDKSDWVGKPVQVGEQVMQIANQENIKLRIQLPVDDAIFLFEGAEVKVFLDVDPLNSLEATVTHASYEASLTPENVLAYTIDAEFVDPGVRRRIGLQGTAKIYEERVSLFYYLFRRPISAIRQFIGV